MAESAAPQATTHQATMTHPIPRWATREQAARYIGVHVNTIDRWNTEGRIQGHRAGPRLIRYDLNEIDAMLTPTTQTEHQP